MAFLAKQFMSLFLLLIISHLISSAHARDNRHFSQFGRQAATTINPTDIEKDEFSQPQKEENQLFYEDTENQHGIDNIPTAILPPPSHAVPTPFLPWNYDTEKYTTSRDPHTQQNQEKAPYPFYHHATTTTNNNKFQDKAQKTVAEKYGNKDSEFYSNSKYEEKERYNDEEEEDRPTVAKKYTMPNDEDLKNQFYYQDNNNNKKVPTEADKYTKTYSPNYEKYQSKYFATTDVELNALLDAREEEEEEDEHDFDAPKTTYGHHNPNQYYGMSDTRKQGTFYNVESEKFDNDQYPNEEAKPTERAKYPSYGNPFSGNPLGDANYQNYFKTNNP